VNVFFTNADIFSLSPFIMFFKFDSAFNSLVDAPDSFILNPIASGTANMRFFSVFLRLDPLWRLGAPD
jgi:hypothetical protein